MQCPHHFLGTLQQFGVWLVKGYPRIEDTVRGGLADFRILKKADFRMLKKVARSCSEACVGFNVCSFRFFFLSSELVVVGEKGIQIVRGATESHRFHDVYGAYKLALRFPGPCVAMWGRQETSWHFLERSVPVDDRRVVHGICPKISIFREMFVW